MMQVETERVARATAAFRLTARRVIRLRPHQAVPSLTSSVSTSRRQAPHGPCHGADA